MKRSLVRSSFIFVAMFMLLAVSAPAAAKATPFSFDYDATTTESLCGFTVERHDVGTAHGRGKPASFDLTNAGVATLTNLETGLSVTEKYQILFKNFNFVENADGTLSSDQTQVGAFKMIGSDGKVLLRGHGPITVRLIINPEATTDEAFFVSREIIVEHGAHPSDELYCQTLTTAIGGS